MGLMVAVYEKVLNMLKSYAIFQIKINKQIGLIDEFNGYNGKGLHKLLCKTK